MSCRDAAYDALTVLHSRLQHAAESSCFADAQAFCTLLDVLRAALPAQQSRRRLPQTTAVFLAEAAVVLTSPGSELYGPVHKFLLRDAALPLHGMPLFAAMHSGQAPDWAQSRRWAAAAAAAAPVAHSLRTQLAASVLAASVQCACSSPEVNAGASTCQAEVHSYVRVARLQATLPAAAQRIVQAGEVLTMAQLAVQFMPSCAQLHVCQQADAAAEPTASSAVWAPSIAAMALAALCDLAEVKQLWRGDSAGTAATQLGIALKQLAVSIADVAHAAQAQACAPQQRQEAQQLAQAFWRLCEAVLTNVQAWQPWRAQLLGLDPAFWLAARSVPCGSAVPGQLCGFCKCLMKYSEGSIAQDGTKLAPWHAVVVWHRDDTYSPLLHLFVERCCLHVAAAAPPEQHHGSAGQGAHCCALCSAGLAAAPVRAAERACALIAAQLLPHATQHKQDGTSSLLTASDAPSESNVRTVAGAAGLSEHAAEMLQAALLMLQHRHGSMLPAELRLVVGCIMRVLAAHDHARSETTSAPGSPQQTC